jgi:hypothetical protein
MKRKIKLPDKPSALIRLAIKDLEAVEKNPAYRIDMGAWHEPYDGKCSVCLAGAVIAQTCKIKNDRYIYPNRDVFGKSTTNKLMALDDFREGSVYGGLTGCGVAEERALKFKDWNVVSYIDHPKEFKSQMRRMATNLKRAGL